VYSKTRGIRNNNPGNIRRTSDRWKGLRPVQTDPEFFQFSSPVYGIRAVARLVRNYCRKYGLCTIREIITRYAPASENDTESYIRSVSESMGVDPDVPLNLAYDEETANLVSAIIRHENGIVPYSAETIREGVALA